MRSDSIIVSSERVARKKIADSERTDLIPRLPSLAMTAARNLAARFRKSAHETFCLHVESSTSALAGNKQKAHMDDGRSLGLKELKREVVNANLRYAGHQWLYAFALHHLCGDDNRV